MIHSFPPLSIHGGPDGGPCIRHDFSTNANPLGAPSFLLEAIQNADREHYPDPNYTALCHQLGKWHQSTPDRIIIAASAGEWIWRLTHWLKTQGRLHQVWVPDPGYMEYRRAAEQQNVSVRQYTNLETLFCHLQKNDLIWCCEPCNPTGLSTPNHLLEKLIEKAQQVGAQLVFDLAYAPLQLDDEPIADKIDTENVWRLFSPNKASAMTGIRGAYAIAPPDNPDQSVRLANFAPSWILGADGECLLTNVATPPMQAWLNTVRQVLRNWRDHLEVTLSSNGWQLQPTSTHFMLAKPPGSPDYIDDILENLRQNHAIKLRNAASFGLPGWVRLRCMPPESQEHLSQAWVKILNTRNANR